MEPSETPLDKELARKLYWAVSSSFPKGLSRQQRASIFSWASELAGRIAAGSHPSLPPPVDKHRSSPYHGQAEGRGGGRNNPSLPRGVTPPPPPNMEAWERDQALLRVRAWAHVTEGRRNGAQIPIPEDVYREVGNGSSDSTSP